MRESHLLLVVAVAPTGVAVDVGILTMRFVQLPPADLAFEVAAELDSGNDVDLLAEAIEEANLTPRQRALIEDALQREAERQGFHAAAHVLRVVGELLARKSTKSAALVKVLGLTTESLYQLAGAFGFKKQSVGNPMAELEAALAEILYDGPRHTRQLTPASTTNANDL